MTKDAEPNSGVLLTVAQVDFETFCRRLEASHDPEKREAARRLRLLRELALEKMPKVFGALGADALRMVETLLREKIPPPGTPLGPRRIEP